MGCIFIAIGMFISALTESQIIAAVGTFGILCCPLSVERPDYIPAVVLRRHSSPVF